MFKKMIIHFEGIPSCEIDLVQSDLIEQWVNVHIENSKKFKYWIRGNAYAYHVTPSSDYKNIKKTIPKKINLALSQLEKLTGVKWPIAVSKSMDFSLLNRMHRMFTVSDATEKNYEIEQHTKNKLWEYKKKEKPLDIYYSQSLKDDSLYSIKSTYPMFTQESKKEFHKIIEEINALIHIYEDSVLVSDRSLQMYKSFNPMFETLIDIDWKYKAIDGTLLTDEITKVDLKYIKNNYYNVDTEYDVYAIKSIRGKDYFLAYQQYDDPTEWDITKTSTLSGGITLDPFRLMNTFYNSEEFKKWLDFYNHPFDPQLFGNISIGRISNNWKQVVKENPAKIAKKNVEFSSSDAQSDFNTLIEEYQISRIEFRK